MNQYKKLLTSLKLKKKKILIPFLVIGDPNINFSFEIVQNLIDNGANAIELGIPFSDPIADGRIVQKANIRAFYQDITIKKCFLFIENIKKKYNSIPIGILVYTNIVYNYGINKFYHQCFQAGVNSVVIADTPIEEIQPFYESALSNKIAPILICPPNANKKLLKKITLFGKGFIYIISRSGVTGITNYKKFSVKKIVSYLKKNISIPLLQGFGITTTNQVSKAYLDKVDGVIFGSVIIKKIEKNYQNKKKTLTKINQIMKKFRQIS